MRSHTVVLALVLCIAYATAENKEALKAVADGAASFGSKFFKEVAKTKPNENLICSSLSAHVVLSMAAYGAGGSTAVEMRNTLHLPSEDTLGLQGFETLIDELNSVKNVTLEVANKIYVSEALELKPTYKALTSGSFRSEAAVLDNEHPSEAAKAINGWVDEKTHHKITEILAKEDIHRDTRMVLLNAIYFKGKWADKFLERNTEDRPFYYLENGEKKEKKVPTMYNKGSYVYGELPELKAKFIELPYENRNLKMVIIVPDEIDGLRNIEENIEAFNYKRLLEVGFERDVHLFLPKFKIESTITLNDPLAKLGMPEMFTGNANFTGISNSGLAVDKVLQKAYIEVNEEGSEAAAVTGFGYEVHSSNVLVGPPIVWILRIDRPFEFVIIDTRKNITLFTGHVTLPQIY